MDVQDLTQEDVFNFLDEELPQTPEVPLDKKEEEEITKKEDSILTEDELMLLTGNEIENKKPADTTSKKESNTISTKEETFDTDKDTFYKARVEYAKTIGRLPEDFELEDDVVLDDDSYSKIMDYENQFVYDTIASQVRQDYVEKLGDNIVKFVEAGGDVTHIAQLVKEQNKVTELTTSTQSGQKAIISKYYSEVLKWNDKRIEKYVDRLIVDNEIEEEANDLKSKFDEHFQEEQSKLVSQQQEQFQKQQEQEKKQIDTFASVLEEKGLAKKDITQYVDYAFVDVELKNGMKMPKLDLKILQIQRNPEELFELIQFIDNKKEFLKRKATEINNPKVDKTFETILKNKASLKGGSTPSELKKPTLTPFKFNF